nr:MAG TPA: hypothetical protein [Caudoviricetes sp.]
MDCLEWKEIPGIKEKFRKIRILIIHRNASLR